MTFDAGVNYLHEATLTTPAGAGKVQFDPGFRVGLATGYELTSWAAVEFDTGFLYNTVKDQGSTWLGEVPFLANFVARAEKEGHKWVPYIGGGVGGAYAMLSSRAGNDQDVQFAWQGMAGVRYRLSDKMAVDFSYKYFGTLEQAYSIGGNNLRLSSINNHMLGASFTVKF